MPHSPVFTQTILRLPVQTHLQLSRSKCHSSRIPGFLHIHCSPNLFVIADLISSFPMIAAWGDLVCNCLSVRCGHFSIRLSYCHAFFTFRFIVPVSVSILSCDLLAEFSFILPIVNWTKFRARVEFHSLLYLRNLCAVLRGWRWVLEHTQRNANRHRP
jgi:hypothetical protein